MTSDPQIDPELADQLELVVDMVNSAFADTMALVARWAEADEAITEARVSGIDPVGIDAVVVSDRGEQQVRLDFSTPIGGLEDLEEAMLSLVAQARVARPTEPLTSVEQRLEAAETQPTNRCQVVAVDDLSPRLRALTVGPLPNWEDLGGDQSLTLFLELPGRPVPETVRLSELRELDEAVRPKGATYSVRRHDPEARTVELWVVRHGDDPATVSGWASQADVGDQVTLWGPRRVAGMPDDVERLVALCDETGVAAALALADELGPRVTVELVVEVQDRNSRFDVGAPAGVTIHWRHRDGEPGTGTALLDAAREILPEPVEGVGVFGAAEARCISAVRRYVRSDLGIPATHCSLTGYWRRTSTP